MVQAYHAIFTAYGFWLPNDPRGSWSEFVAAWELVLAGGTATTTGTRRSVAGVAHDREARLAAKRALKFQPVTFTGIQARAVARGFEKAIGQSGYVVHACSILPEHVHMVVARHAFDIEQIVGHFKGNATHALIAENLHPLCAYRTKAGAAPTPWAENCWKVFLNEPEDIARAIAYVERNPMKEGKRPQRWSFVEPTNV